MSRSKPKLGRPPVSLPNGAFESMALDGQLPSTPSKIEKNKVVKAKPIPKGAMTRKDGTVVMRQATYLPLVLNTKLRRYAFENDLTISAAVEELLAQALTLHDHE